MTKKPRKRWSAVKKAREKLRRRAKGIGGRTFMSSFLNRPARGHEERFEADEMLDDLARK